MPITTEEEMAICESKKFFGSRSAAMKTKKKATQREGKQFSVYKCDVCPGFHLTTNYRKHNHA